MPKTKTQKQQFVQNISEKLGRAKAVVFADYKGLTMPQLSDLRSKLAETDSEFTVTKNTLIQRAIGNGQLKIDNSQLQGPTAALLAYDDEITPIKILVKALTEAGVGKVKAGFLGVQPLNEARIVQLATLPSKDELRGKTVGVLVAPLQGMVGVLQGNLRNLVYALSEIQKMKGGV